MSLDTTLQETIGTIPECVAAGYLDMSTGMLLGVKTVEPHPPEVLDMVAAATADLFQGASIAQLEKMFRASRGQGASDAHYFKEIIIFSDNFLHVFLRTRTYPDNVVVFVCRKNANPGMVLAKSRMAIETVSAAV